MNKTQLIARMAQACGLTHIQAESVLKAFTDAVTESLANGEKVQVTGFGVFETRKHAARIGRDLNTGKEINIPEKTTVAFHSGTQLKKAVSR